MSFSTLPASGLGLCHVTRRRSGASRVRDDLQADRADAAVIGGEGFAGMRSDDRLLRVLGSIKGGQMKSSNVRLVPLFSRCSRDRNCNGKFPVKVRLQLLLWTHDEMKRC